MKYNNALSSVDMPNDESLFAGQLREIVILLRGLRAVEDSAILHFEWVSAPVRNDEVYSGDLGELID